VIIPASSTLPPADPRLLFLQSDAADPPVTVIRDIRVRRGSEPVFERDMGLLIAEATRQPGHLGATILRPRDAGPGSPDFYRFVYKFDQRSRLLAWHNSEARSRLNRAVAAHVLSDDFSEYPGLETWFDLPGHAPPPKWKTTLMTWAAIYGLVVAFSYALRVLHVAFPIPVTALLLTGAVVPLVAYVVGPFLGRLLHPWLHAASR
jgi:antibiotic biosynthesis monooxygenase (ABM) superfamily enzyme